MHRVVLHVKVKFIPDHVLGAQRLLAQISLRCLPQLLLLRVLYAYDLLLIRRLGKVLLLLSLQHLEPDPCVVVLLDVLQYGDVLAVLSLVADRFPLGLLLLDVLFDRLRLVNGQLLCGAEGRLLC